MPVDLTAAQALLTSTSGAAGPWRLVDVGDDTGRVRILDADNEDVIYIGDDGRWEALELDLIAAAPDLHRELTDAVEEIARLREELEKPVAGAWVGKFRPSERGYTMAVVGEPGFGWQVWHNTGGPAFASGPETSDAGRHAADLALLAAGYRLVGGVHPLAAGEVDDV